MSDRLDAVIDHVAIAVPSWDAGERRWREELGGGVVAYGKAPVFWSKQLRYANGGKLELLAPPEDAGPDNFVRRFLDRFGAQIHHVTLKVPDLALAVDTLRSVGLEPVDVQMENPHWQEAFLRPSVVGGLVVQVAWSDSGDEGWARRIGHTPEPAAPGAPALTGPLLRHPDLEAAAELWQTLGAEVSREGERLVCSWPESPLVVVIKRGEEAGPVALLGSGVAPLPADPDAGPPLQLG
jgi:catechol 2,3-dioxygenase-like lactoylglutathione lyase family enzyme